MKSTPKKGIYTDEILPGIILTADANIKVITVVNPYGSNCRFEYPEGFYPSDIAQIKASILRTTKVGDYQVEA